MTAKRRRWASGVACLVLAALFVLQKFPFRWELHHDSIGLMARINLLAWLLPLAALGAAFISGSDTLRALSIGLGIVVVPLVGVGLLWSGWHLDSLEREVEQPVGRRMFVAYTTNYGGAVGDFGLEVWQETPVGLGFRVARQLPVGGPGCYFRELTPLDDRCASVRYAQRDRPGEQTRTVCMHDSESP